MNLKISSKNNSERSHDFIQTFLQSYHTLLYGILIFIILIPIFNIAIPDRSIFNINYTHEQLKFQFFLEQLTPVIVGTVIVYGIMVGHILFKFMYDRKEISVFFSIGLDRKTLYLNRILLGVLILILAIMIPMIISFILNIKALGRTEGMINCFLSTSIGLLLMSMISMVITSITCCLVGTTKEFIVYLFTFLSGETMVLYGTNGMMKHLLWGNIYGTTTYLGTTPIEEGLVWKLSNFNPLICLYKDIKQNARFYRELTIDRPTQVSFNLHLIWIVVIVILLFIGLRKIKTRKAESAGIWGQKRSIDRFILYVYSFISFSVSIEIMWPFGSKVAIGTALLIMTICYIVFQKLIFKDNRKLSRGIFTLVSQLSINFLILLIIMNGGLGYSRRIPDIEDIKKVSISYTGSPYNIIGELVGSINGRGYYVNKDYEYFDKEEKQKLIDIHKEYISQYGEKVGTNDQKFKKTVVPYDIKIKYTLYNGKEYSRYYNRSTLDTLEQMLSLDDTSTMKNRVNEIVLGVEENDSNNWSSGAFEYGEIYLSDSYYYNPKVLKMNQEKRKKLRESIAKDLNNQTTQERYFPNKPATGVVMLSQNGQADSESFAYSLQNVVLYINEDFINTNSFLKEHDLTGYFKFEENIESITVQKYDPFGGINKVENPNSSYFLGYKSNLQEDFWISEDFGVRPVFTEKSEIEELIPLLRNNYFMSDGGYLVSIKIYGEDVYVYKYLPQNLAPDFVKERLD